MVVREDVVVAVSVSIAGQFGHGARLLGIHLNGAKLLQEELVVVGPHHQELVDKAVGGDRRMALQCLRAVVDAVLLHGVSEFVAAATGDAHRAAPLQAAGGCSSFLVVHRTGCWGG